MHRAACPSRFWTVLLGGVLALLDGIGIPSESFLNAVWMFLLYLRWCGMPVHFTVSGFPSREWSRLIPTLNLGSSLQDWWRRVWGNGMVRKGRRPPVSWRGRWAKGRRKHGLLTLRIMGGPNSAPESLRTNLPPINLALTSFPSSCLRASTAQPPPGAPVLRIRLLPCSSLRDFFWRPA